MNTKFVQVNKYLKYLHNNTQSIAVPRNNEDIFFLYFFMKQNLMHKMCNTKIKTSLKIIIYP